jgi:transcriptional regulator with XRE-family HTH domain
MTTAEQLGSQIRAARDRAQLSLRELEDRVQISASTIGEYERGVRVPEADKLARIATALNQYTFRIDDYTFSIAGSVVGQERREAGYQLPLNFVGEYNYAKAQVKIQPGRISISLEGAKARTPRLSLSRN